MHQTFTQRKSSVPVYSIQSPTSFFLQALESQKAVLEEKKQNASINSPFKAKDVKSRGRKDSRQERSDKKSVLDSLTFDMLNPVVLINKE